MRYAEISTVRSLGENKGIMAADITIIGRLLQLIMTVEGCLCLCR